LTLLEKLKEVQNNGKALLAANFYNLETCKGIAEAAAELNCPVILQLTPASIKYMGLKTALAIARSVSAEENIQSWVHLDHCSDKELVKLCLDEGFDSVMFDASIKDITENISLTRSVVMMAEPYHVNIEAELGYVPKPDTEVDREKFTKPQEAKRFVEETGVSSLAIAVGSKHGFYKGEPNLDIQRITELKKVTDAYLVLHGSSGIPAEQLKDAVTSGISKVNIATETKHLFMRSLKDILLKTDDIDLRNVFPPAINNIKTMIQHKIETVSMAYNSQL